MAAFQFPDPAVQTTVTNPITGSTYQWKEPPGKWVVTVKMRDVGSIIWEGDNPPDPIGDYKLWYSTDTLELYFYYCDANSVCAWVPTSAPITMLEDLDNTVFELRTDLTSVNLAVRENENAIGRTIYFSDSPPAIYDDIDSGNELADGTPIMVPNELNYKFWYDTARLELLILFRDEDGDDSYVPVSIPLESLPEPGVSTETFTYTTGRLQTAIEENYLHNLNQDTSINEIKNDIIELEEEIDAIAPSVERGVWAFNLGGLASSRGQLSMYDNDYSNVGSPIGIFKQAKSIWLNEEDSAGTPHGFDNVEAGNLLELFVEGESDYGLFEVVDVHDETNGVASWWVIEVNFVRALSDTSLASNGDNIRLKIFSAPSGGTADEFVLKAGDSMTGRLQLERELDKVDFKTPTAITDASISFANTKLNGAKYVASIFQPGADTSLSCSNSFYAKTLYTSNNFYGYYEKTEADGRKTRESKYPRMSFFSDINDPTDRNKDYGVLKFNNSDRLIWNKSGGNIQNDNGMVLEWNSSYGYLWLPKVGNTALTWGKDGVVVFRDSYGSFGTPGQVLTRTTDANYMQWAEPATAGQVLTNWDLINANNKNWGNEFYHQALTTGFGGYKSNGDEYNGQSNYGIFISDSMLEKLLKEDYPDKEIDIDKWVKYWTGEGTIELNTGGSGTSGTSQTRTLTEVKRVNYNNDGRYPGVKLMWADQASLSFYTLYIKFVKTAGAFEAGEVNTIQVPANNILYYTGSYTPSSEEDVNDSTVYWLDRNGRISNSTPSNGAFFPWAWIKENYPWMTGLNIMDGLGVSGIYDAFGNAKSLLDPTKTFNSFPAYVNPREFNGVRGIGIWSDNQMSSNDRIQLWGLQEAFEYYTINN